MVFHITPVFQLLLSAVLGGAIGIEREAHGRPAGFRTHIMVGVGATLLMQISLYMYQIFHSETMQGFIRLDPARIAAMTIPGIGFLGAGAIIHDRGGIRGLTTAACLWVVAAVGLAVGCSYYLPAVVATIISLFSLTVLEYIDRFIPRDSYFNLVVCFLDGKDGIGDIENILQKESITVLKKSIQRDLPLREVRYEMNLRVRVKRQPPDILHPIASLDGVKRVELS